MCSSRPHFFVLSNFPFKRKPRGTNEAFGSKAWLCLANHIADAIWAVTHERWIRSGTYSVALDITAISTEDCSGSRTGW